MRRGEGSRYTSEASSPRQVRVTRVGSRGACRHPHGRFEVRSRSVGMDLSAGGGMPHWSKV